MGEALDYGYSLFETIRFQASEAQNLKGHFGRLSSSAKALGISFTRSFSSFSNEIQTSINDSGMTRGQVRYQVLKEGATSTSQIQVKTNRYTKPMYDEGFKLTFSEAVKSSTAILVNHKTSNYLENLLAVRQAQSSGFDEALFLNEEAHLTEGAYTNLFFIKGNEVYTPDLSCGLLKGTMRAQVIEVLKQEGIQIETGHYKTADLQSADLVFVTNALMGLMPVKEINNVKQYKLKHDIVNLLSDRLMADWFE